MSSSSNTRNLPTVAILFVDTDEQGRSKGEALVRGRGIRKARVAFDIAPWMPRAAIRNAADGRVYMSPAETRISMAIKAKLEERIR